MYLRFNQILFENCEGNNTESHRATQSGYGQKFETNIFFRLIKTSNGQNPIIMNYQIKDQIIKDVYKQLDFYNHHYKNRKWHEKVN